MKSYIFVTIVMTLSCTQGIGQNTNDLKAIANQTNAQKTANNKDILTTFLGRELIIY